MRQRPIVVVGGTGQIASALARLGEIAERPVVTLGRPDLDLAIPASLVPALAARDPCLVINAAVYTAVDHAETDREVAFQVNAEAPGGIARFCRFGFAREIFAQTARRGLAVPRLRPIAAAGYPGSARRPAYSVLDNRRIQETFGIFLPPWEEGVRRCLEALVGAGMAPVTTDPEFSRVPGRP